MKRALLLSVAATLVLAGCGADTGPTDAIGPTGTAATPGDTATGPVAGDVEETAVLSVSTAFYPLQFAVEQLGGPLVAVTSLTPPGAEPHDVELTPRQVAGMTEDDLVVYLSGFQPAVDQAAQAVAADRTLDVAPVADLTLAAADHGPDHGHDDGHDHDEGALDPHFWLDPTRYASVARAITDRLVQLDPDNSGEYEQNLTEFEGQLTDLDDEFTAGLAQCTHRDLVTGHAAFGYLADRYELRQVGIAGLTPHSEPSPTQLRDLITHVRESGVTTVYSETLVDPALAETIAREAGVELRTLDPLEGLSEASQGDDYFEVMRANLAVLVEGQDCT